MKRILSIILILSFMFSLCTFDVTANTHWAQSVSEELVKIGIVSGDESGDLKLDNNITRAEFVKVINKAFGYTNKADSNFSDVSEDKWYYNEFLIAKLQGVITGDELGNANPEAVITRNEAAVILARALKLDTTDSATQIKDIDLIPDWAKGSVIALNNKGIINGYSDGEFKGDNTLKRGESFSLIGNIIKQSEKEEPENKENDPITAPPSNVNTNVSTGGGGGGGSSSGGGSSIISPLPMIAETPLLKFNASNGYLLSWKNCYGASSYIVKIKIAGETEIEIPVSVNSIELFSYFADYASLRDNASEDFLVSVKSVGLSGYKSSSYSKELKIKAEFECIGSPAITARYGAAGGVGRAIVTWEDVPDATDYNVTLLVDGVEMQDGYLVDKLNKEVLIPDTSFITDDTVLSIVAVSNDPMYKNSDPTVKKLVIEKEEAVEQDGSEEKPWLISTAEEFYKIGAEGSKYLKTDYYVITNDFVVTKPLIMADGKGFEGSIKGSLNGSNFKPTITLNIGANANPYSENTHAGFVANLKGTIENLIFEGNVYLTTGVTYSGAACGYLDGGIISDCINNAMLISNDSATNVGGLVGYAINQSKIENCINNGEITAQNYAAGISARVGGSATILSCYNTGKISANVSYAGGIVANLGTGTIKRCANYGEVYAATNYAGGIGAYCNANGAGYDIYIEECFNAGMINNNNTSSGALAGLVYMSKGNSTDRATLYISNFFHVEKENNKVTSIIGAMGRNKGDRSGMADFKYGYSTSPVKLVKNDYPYNKDDVYLENKITHLEYYYSGDENAEIKGENITNDALEELLDNSAFDSIDEDLTDEENDAVWFVSDGSDGYNYPQLVHNPYKKETVIIPKLTNVTAVNDGEKLKFSWILPDGVSRVSVKINNNSRIEAVTDGYVELSDDLTTYTLDSYKDNSYYEIFVKMEFNDGSEFIDNKEILVNIQGI